MAAGSRRTRTLEFLLIAVLSLVSSSRASDPPLTLDYYESSCPNLLAIVRKEMECVVTSDPRNAALIVRLHFHDCFVQGCDGSVLLDDTVMLKGEKTASQNLNSLAGFDIIDQIKNKIESECPEIVSCADILTIAARDATILVGGPYWDVPLGRKDSKTAGYDLANENIPSANEGLAGIISKFLYQGLSVTDTVALSGAHTIGMARCENFRARVTGYSSKSSHLNSLQKVCPAAGGKEDNIAPMDYVTPSLFDNSYFNLLLRGEGLLNSDQELYSSLIEVQTKGLVTKYAKDSLAFFNQFAESMVKLGNITNSDSFVTGEVRKSCRFINTEEPQH